jgi:hypothetical protein
MIDRVEVFHFSDSPGIAITFFYNTSCEDTFEVFEEDQIARVMGLITAGADPESVLIALRHIGNFQLH